MPQEISAHLCAVCGSRHSSKSVGVRGPSVLVCASRKSSLCRTGLGIVVPASSRSMRKQHPLLLACLPPKHLYSYRHLSTSREKLRKSIYSNVALQVKTLQHVGGLFVGQFGHVKILLPGKEMPGSICLQQIIAIRTGLGFVLKRFWLLLFPASIG